MSSFEEWVKALKTIPEGRIWWNNFEFDKKCGNLTPDVLTRFTEAFRTVIFEADAMVDVDELPIRIQAAFDKVIEMNPQVFDLQGTRSPLHLEPYCRVMTIGNFVNNNFDFGGLGLEVDESLDEKVWIRIGRHGTSEFYQNSLRTRRRFFWCARSVVVDGLRIALGATDHFATELRNQLGLIGIGENEKILQITIPPEKLESKVVRAPTVLDAGLINFVFVSCNDPLGCGWTLNLSNCQKGVEELVIEELPFNRDYEVQRLGITLTPSPDLNLALLETESERRLE